MDSTWQEDFLKENGVSQEEIHAFGERLPLTTPIECCPSVESMVWNLNSESSHEAVQAFFGYLCTGAYQDLEFHLKNERFRLTWPTSSW
jgi:hypothetical protein